MKNARLALAWTGILATAAACGPPTNTFSGAPMPPMVDLTCELRSVQSGVLNPTYWGDRSDDGLALTFTNLDADSGTAMLVGNIGAGTVEFRKQAAQWQFIELTPSGNMTLTSVFAPPSVGEALPAVLSRHILIAPGNVSISQYAGSCVPKH